MIKVGSSEWCNQAQGFEGDKCNQDEPSRSRDDFLQFAREKKDGEFITV